MSLLYYFIREQYNFITLDIFSVFQSCASLSGVVNSMAHRTSDTKYMFRCLSIKLGEREKSHIFIFSSLIIRSDAFNIYPNFWTYGNCVFSFITQLISVTGFQAKLLV
mgnify:CR=1 FL=1